MRHSFLRNTCFIFSAVLLLLVAIFSATYFFSSYWQLSQWYMGLSDCFYQKDNWTGGFFTEEIKKSGNIYCVISIVISLAGLWYIWIIAKSYDKRIHSAKEKKRISEKINVFDFIAMLFCCVCGITFWYYGFKSVPPSFDEVFSAQNFAGINWFQCISYYKLPNNHIFFNLINNLLFHPFQDKVITGRVISLFAYVGFILCIYRFSKLLFKSSAIAFTTTVACLTQFFIRAFSFQARGYELYLLAELGVVVTIFFYVLNEIKPSTKENNRRLLWLNALCSVAGYFIMPSFLYFHVAVLVFMALYGIIYRFNCLPFFKIQIFIIALVFMCYLPALCFSGLQTITANHYVAPMSKYKDVSEFIQKMFPVFFPCIDHILSDIQFFGVSINKLLLVAPAFLLLFRKNKPMFTMGIFYVVLWLVFFSLVVIMKRFPFERNLIGQYSLTLLANLCLIYATFTLVFKKSNKLFVAVPCTIISVLFIIHFIKTNDKYQKDTPYEYEVTYYYTILSEGMRIIPAGSDVGFSDESFYCSYICKNKGCIIKKCLWGNEKYYVKKNDEPLPPILQISKDSYQLISTVNEYEIYKRE